MFRAGPRRRLADDPREGSPALATPDALVDPLDIERAWRLLRVAGARFDRVAREMGWPTPFGPLRFLILAHLEQATAYGFSARRLARALGVSPSTLAHHLDVLERAGLILRAPWTIYDRRKVAVRLTEAGRSCLTLLSAQPAPPPMYSPAIASP